MENEEVQELIAKAREISNRVEAAVDSIKNPFAATSKEQEETVIAAAELLGSVIDALEICRMQKRLTQDDWRGEWMRASAYAARIKALEALIEVGDKR